MLESCIVRALRKTAELSVSEWDDAYLDDAARQTAQTAAAHGWSWSWSEPFEVKLSEKEFEDVALGRCG